MQSLTRALPAATAEAIESNLYCFLANTSYSTRFTFHEDAAIMWTITGIRSYPPFNCVTRARLDPRNVDRAIEAAVLRAATRKVSIQWWQGPSCTPSDIGQRLLAHGFAASTELPGMALDLREYSRRPPAVEDLEILEVTTLRRLEEWVRVCAVGSDMPPDAAEVWGDLYQSLYRHKDLPIHHYLGAWKGKPIGTATVMFGAGVAGIYNVATVPFARRRGVGAALTDAALRHAAAAGYETAVLQSTPMGAGLYRELGFQQQCAFSTYLWPKGAAWTS